MTAKVYEGMTIGTPTKLDELHLMQTDELQAYADWLWAERRKVTSLLELRKLEEIDGKVSGG